MANALEPRVAALEIQVQEVSARLDKLEVGTLNTTAGKVEYLLDMTINEVYQQTQDALASRDGKGK